MKTLEELLEAARQVRQHAHAPYSTFKVGAAVRGASGRIYTGCNIEISSYSHTCCAERVAVFKAVSEGERELVACAVITDVSPPAPPCGACRQVLHDFGPHMSVLMANTQGEQVQTQLTELLPNAFTPDKVLEKLKH